MSMGNNLFDITNKGKIVYIDPKLHLGRSTLYGIGVMECCSELVENSPLDLNSIVGL